jgi:alpha-beta hydrolase superfamily lysophospholipase
MSSPPAHAKESRFATHDGLRLLARHWPARATPKRLGIVLVHGVAEHSGRYARLADTFTSFGFDVHAFDLRGHGLSEGRRVHVSRWDEYRRDLVSFLARVDEQQGNAPVVLYGHSLGSLIVLDYLIETCDTKRPLDQDGASTPGPHAATARDVECDRAGSPSTGPVLLGAILSGPPFRPVGVARPWKIVAARLLSRVWPTCRLPLNLDPNALSRDPEVVQAFRTDPLIEPLGTARWGMEALSALRRVQSRAAEIRCPILILHGEQDQVSMVQGSQELFTLLTSPDKQLRICPGALHEPHNDLGSAELLADVRDWLECRLQASQHSNEGEADTPRRE